jgi:hypothetical protein
MGHKFAKKIMRLDPKPGTRMLPSGTPWMDATSVSEE